MLRGLLVALLIAEGITVEASAWAGDPLADGRAAVAESDYVAARPALAAALEAGGHGPDELAEIYRLTGIVEAALGDAKAATDAFTQLLALSPKATLPAGTSPKLKRPFDAAVRYFKTHAPLALTIETVASPPTITLVSGSDPLGMVAKAHVVFTVDGGPERTKDVIASERTDIALPAARRIDARLAALDAHGNRLIEIGSKEVPIVIVGQPGPEPVAPVVVAAHPVEPARSRVAAAGPLPVYRRWWPYAAATAVFGGAAGYFAWTARSDSQQLDRLNADSVHHQFSEAKSVEDHARRSALFANIGLGVAGAFAIVSGVMYLAAPHDHLETRITAVPVAGGGAIVYGGNF